MTPAPGTSRSPFLLTWEELHCMPSQSVDGFSYAKEMSYRCSTACFIQEVGKALRFPQLSISTALVFMHRFYSRKSFQEYDRFIMSCTCLLLGGKVEETPKKLKDVLCEAFKKRYNVKASEVPDPESRKFWELKEQVLVSERVLLQTLGFELQLEHPYRELLAFVRSVQKSRDFAQLAWNFVNDSYRTTVCLQYDHKTIAAAAIAMVASLLGEQLKNPTTPERPWYEAISPLVSETDLFACANTIVDFYEVIKPAMEEGTREAVVTLTPAELQRIRESIGAGGGTRNVHSLAFADEPQPAHLPTAASTGEATKRQRETGADEPALSGVKQPRSADHGPPPASAPASTPPRAEPPFTKAQLAPAEFTTQLTPAS